MNLVLDKGYVKLIEHYGRDERIIEAARMSTGKGFQGWGKGATKGDEGLLRYLYENRHHTPFEMAGMVVEVKAPIFVFREWHRHRTQSYNELSGRYTPLPSEDYLPDRSALLVRAREAGKNKQAQAAADASELDEAGAVSWLTQLNQLYAYAQAVYEDGLRLGVPKELARLPVPVARYSKMRAAANLRNWLAFMTLRCDPHAQAEIREYAWAVAGLIAEKFPRTYALWFAGHRKGTT